MSVQRTITEAELLENLAWVQALARRLVPLEADDLVQQVCVAALDRGRIASASEAQTGPRVRAWLSRATVYLATNLRRGHLRRLDRERLAARPEVLPSTHEIVERNSQLVRAVQAVHELPEPYRTTVLLKFLDGLSTREIARQTGANEALVRKRLSRGLQRLRAALNPTPLSGLFGLGWLIPFPVAGPPSTQLGVVTMGTTQTTLVASASLAGLAITAAVLTSSPVEPDAELRSAEVATAQPLLVADPTEVDLSPKELIQPPMTERAVVSPAPEAKLQPAGTDEPQVDPRLSKERRPPAQFHEPVILGWEFEYSVEQPYLLEERFVKEVPLPPDGYLVRRFEDGSPKAEGMILNGHEDGEWTHWHANGERKSQGTYFAGQKHGDWTRWDENGNLFQELTFRYDRKEGLVKKFEDGVQQTTEYRDGEKHGVRRRVAEGGTLLLEQAWFRDKKHGLSVQFHPNGKLASRGSFEHGVRAEDWEFWTEDGEIDEELTLADVPPRTGSPLFVGTPDPGDPIWHASPLPPNN